MLPGLKVGEVDWLFIGVHETLKHHHCNRAQGTEKQVPVPDDQLFICKSPVLRQLISVRIDEPALYFEALVAGLHDIDDIDVLFAHRRQVG